MCKAGACTATLLEANAYQGTLKGQFSVARGARGLTTQATVSLADADLGAAFADFGWSGFHGRGDVEADLRATGFAASDSILSLAGQASATLTAGADRRRERRGGVAPQPAPPASTSPAISATARRISRADACA